MTQQKPNPPPAGEPDKANSSTMVVVGCKLPNGLICELGKYGDDGYRRVVLNGSNHSRVVGGFGMTDVSKDFWEAWYGKHKKLDFVRRGMVFVHSDLASAKDYAQERAEVRSGLEPLDPLKKQHNAKGEVLLEADMDHFAQAKRAAMQAGAVRPGG